MDPPNMSYDSEAAIRSSVKQVFLKILQNSQEKTCNFIKKETLAQVFSCEFWEFLTTPFL